MSVLTMAAPEASVAAAGIAEVARELDAIAAECRKLADATGPPGHASAAGALAHAVDGAAGTLRRVLTAVAGARVAVSCADERAALWDGIAS